MSAKRSISKARPAPVPALIAARPEALLAEVRTLILEARQQTARMVNAGLTLLYWQVGDRIRREVLQGQRAEYGAEILRTLSAQLEEEFGRGFSEKSLRHMVRFAEAFSDARIVSALLRHLSWTHFLSIIYLKDPLQKRETVEVLELEPRGIHVAEYLTELPPRELLQQRLHDAVVRTRLRLEQQTASAAPAEPSAARKKGGKR